jgi:glycosyltransferase involved in cell wall biosynthesis
MAGPLASVIVPVFNGARFLGDALTSALAQDYAPVEVIVVDDGSDDGTEHIARSFPVQYLHQPNQGTAAARNTGIAASRGEFLSFLDCDDTWPPGKLSVQIRYLLDHLEVDCTMGRQEVTVAPGVPRPAWLVPDRLLGAQGGIPYMSAVLRREVVDAVGGFDPTYRTAEDMDWIFRIKASGARIEILPDVVLHRRVHGSNKSNGFTRASLFTSLHGLIQTRRQGDD